MTPSLAYPLAAPLLALAALLFWSRWARRGGAWALGAGVLALAVAIDAVRALLQRVEDDAGGPAPATVAAIALGLFGLFALRAWWRVGATPGADGPDPDPAPPQGPGPEAR